MENPEFLNKKYPDLPGSKPVERAVQKKLREGEKGPTSNIERTDIYLTRLEKFFSAKEKRHIDTPRGPVESESGFERLKRRILDQYVTKYEEIPESYWHFLEKIMRERGQGGDWDRATPEQKEQMKQENANAVLADQRDSLEEWIDYFALPDSNYIPRELKYWIFRNILNLKEFAKVKIKKPDGTEEERIEFNKRSRGTVAKYPDLNQEALNYIIDSVKNKLAGQNMEFGYDIPAEAQQRFRELLSKEDFSKLYAWANEYMNPIPKHLLPVTDGEWVKYTQGSDPQELVKTIRGRGTGWCIAGETTCEKYLQGGDIYVYYSVDDNDQPTLPRLAIRFEGDRIAENPRGIAYKQNIDPYMPPILEEKLEGIGSVGKQYQKMAVDMEHLTAVDNKAKNGESLNKEDLTFLYEIESKIEGFGYLRDPRIQELRKNRNQEHDMLTIFDCTPEQVAKSIDEINENARVYVGNWDVEVHQKIRDYPQIKHLFESFPEKKILKLTLETDPQVNSPESAEEALDSRNIYLTDWSRDILKKTEFSQERQKYELARFTVEQLGFPNGATTQEIYDKAKKLGIGLCPAEVGPHLRLKYPGGEWMLIAMKQITDRSGDPDVFDLGSLGVRLELRSSGARPGRRWGGGSEVVFLSASET